MEDVYLKDIRHEYHKDEEVCDWKFLQVKDYEVRIYYKPSEEKGLGFNFYANTETFQHKPSFHDELISVTETPGIELDANQLNGRPILRRVSKFFPLAINTSSPPKLS